MNQMKEMTGNPKLVVNEEMAKGEFDYRPVGGGESGNQKLLNVLDQSGRLKVLEKRNGGLPLTPQQKQEFTNQAFLDYCRACAIMVNTQDMAKVAAVYRNGGRLIDRNTGVATQVLPKEIADIVHNSNTVSGSYNESGTQLAKNNFGGKTGVDGGIFGSLLGHPDLVVATHHSDLNAAGNSGEGQKWINLLNKLKLRLPQRAAPQQAAPQRAASRKTGLFGMFKNTTTVANRQSELSSIAPGELGLSPLELDEKLRSETTTESLRAIASQLSAPPYDKKAGFYMKIPDVSKGKDQFVGVRRILTAADTKSVLKDYFLAEDDHQLHKVVVTDATETPLRALRTADAPTKLSVDIPSAALDIPGVSSSSEQ
jgi:glutaminase